MVNINKNKLKDHFNKLSPEDQVTFIKETALRLNRSFKSKERAAKRELESNAQRIGIRGGLATTLTARTMKATDSYLYDLETLKFIITLI